MRAPPCREAFVEIATVLAPCTKTAAGVMVIFAIKRWAKTVEQIAWLGLGTEHTRLALVKMFVCLNSTSRLLWETPVFC